MIGIILSSCRKTVTSSIQHFFLRDFGRGYHCNKCWSLANLMFAAKNAKTATCSRGSYITFLHPCQYPGKSLLFLHFEAKKQTIRHLPSLRFLTLILLDHSTSKMQTSDQSPSPGDSPIRYNVGNGKRLCPTASVVGIFSYIFVSSLFRFFGFPKCSGFKKEANDRKITNPTSLSNTVLVSFKVRS